MKRSKTFEVKEGSETLDDGEPFKLYMINGPKSRSWCVSFHVSNQKNKFIKTKLYAFLSVNLRILEPNNPHYS